jgi:hypothetical protein
LEQAIADELIRVPPGPSAAELQRRAAVRGGRRAAAAVAAIVLVFVGLEVGAALHSDDRHIVVTEPTPTTAPIPVAGIEQFPPLVRITETVRGLVRMDVVPDAHGARHATAQIVSTTREGIPPFEDLSAGSANGKYVVQVIGAIDCKSCFGVASRPHGPAFSVLFDAAGNLIGTTTGPRIYDLTRLGTVYRLALGPL